MIYIFFLSLAAYLLGSIPFGLIFASLNNFPDLRTQGSGNIGATNVMRIMGAKLALITLFCDTVKGSIAVLLPMLMDASILSINSAAIFAVLGHVFPIWLKFRGGKGVATTLGVIIILNLKIAILFTVVWSVIFFLFRYASLSSIIAIFVSSVVGCFATTSQAISLLTIALIVIIKHRTNILRLIKGEEKKIILSNKLPF